jgi:hypothetical protein
MMVAIDFGLATLILGICAWGIIAAGAVWR